MDLDPNYDPSDFLHMPSKKEPVVKIDYTNIKQEPTSQPQIYEQDTSFSMSEMLLYENRTTKTELGQAQTDSVEIDVQSQVLEYSTQETYSAQEQPVQLPQQNSTQNEGLDNIGIHDDLAISDSDEEQQHGGDSSKNQSESVNDNDDDQLWF